MEGNIGLSLLTQVDWLMYFGEKQHSLIQKL